MGMSNIQAYSLHQSYEVRSVQGQGGPAGCKCHAAGYGAKISGSQGSNGTLDARAGREWGVGKLQGDRVTLSGQGGADTRELVYAPAFGDRYHMFLDQRYGGGRFEPVIHGAKTWSDDAGEWEDPMDFEKGEVPESLSGGSPPASGEEDLSMEELRVLEELKQRDLEVRTHEQAHIAAGGQYVTSGASYTYQYGPDGKSYAVGGEVSIDVSPVPGDPEQTEQKARAVRRAAMAPANPSAQDIQVAARATQLEAEAQVEKLVEQRHSQNVDSQTAIRAYQRSMVE